MKYLKILDDKNNTIYSCKSRSIVICFDDNYVYPAVNTMFSIFMHNKDVNFICVCSFLNNSSFQYLLSIKEFGVRVLLLEWSKMVDTRFYSIDVAFNAYLPWILPEIDKCLYVDPDVLCLKNISEVFDCNSMISMSVEISGIVNNLSSKLPGNKKDDVFYFNTGVLFLNLERIRNSHTVEEIDEEFIEKIDQYYLLDQDFFNSFYKNDIKPLPLSWNVQWYEFAGGYFYKKVIKDAYFIHFSFHKPWRHTSPYKQSALYLKLSRNKETRKMVKTARRKRVFYLLKKAICTPFSLLIRKLKK